MKTIHNTTFCQIIVHKSFTKENEDNVINFTPFDNKDKLNSNLLQRYTFSRSTNDFVGEFSFSFEEKRDNLIFDKINCLDIVFIYEQMRDDEIKQSELNSYNDTNDRITPSKDGIDILEKKVNLNKLKSRSQLPTFIGVVESKSVSATAGTNQKICTIAGSSIESLFNKFYIATDATAMAYSGTAESVNKNVLDMIYSQNGGLNGAKIKEIIKLSYKEFRDVSTGEGKYKETSNYKNIAPQGISELIDKYYGDDFIECDEDLTLPIPLATTLITSGSCNFITYIRAFLPQETYDVYGVIDYQGKPKIKVRIKPFSFEKWDTLLNVRIAPWIITDYAFTKSCNDVYTAFFTYVEGSSQTPDFYKKVQAGNKGYENAQILEDKINKYGYKPLFCSFTGYDIAAKDKEEQIKKEEYISEKCNEFNKLIKEWYEHNDEYYNGSITCQKIDGWSYPVIGEKLQLIDMQMYIMSESHSWNYGSSITIKYDCTRGGIYSKKVIQASLQDSKKIEYSFKEITDLSKYLKEVDL